MGKSFVSYRIEDRSYASFIKREIHLEVSRARFTETKVGEIDIIISEVTSNLVKHAGHGEILYRTSVSNDADPVFEVLSIDKGPGMADPQKMMADGVSTTGTLGQGLGAIFRLSSLAQLYSIPGMGTILYARVGGKQKRKSIAPTIEIDVHALCVNKPRETVCGDGYLVMDDEASTRIFFGDGLGHGEHAKAAIDGAKNFFFECSDTSPVDVLRQMHEKVRRTRGLVGSIAVFDKANSLWRICGVGNIAVKLFSGLQLKNYMSYNGTIGLNIPNSLKESVFPAERNQHLVMCTDGIRTRWSLNDYPAIYKYDNMILAAALYRDHARGIDDASVLIAKVS